MSNRSGRQRFLAKTSYQIRIVADQIGKNDFNGVLSFEKDVPCFIDDTHAALAETLLELIATVEDRLTLDRQGCLNTVVRTVIDLVGETTATGWALFHSLVSTATLTPRGLRRLCAKDFSG